MVNQEKIKLMVFGSCLIIRRLPDFKKPMPSESVKDLGVTFDHTLLFDNHTSGTVSFCMSKLAQLQLVQNLAA